MTRKTQLSSVFAFGVVAIGIVIYLGFRPAERLSDVQVDILRVVLALGAGGIVAFLPGALQVEIPTIAKGAGAVAAFLLVFFFGPETDSSARGEGASHLGYLANLYDGLQSNVPESDFLLEFDPTFGQQLRLFRIESEKTGRNWGEVVSKICRAYPCLVCDPGPGQITDSVRISLAAPGAVERVGGGIDTYYRCKQE